MNGLACAVCLSWTLAALAADPAMEMVQPLPEHTQPEKIPQQPALSESSPGFAAEDQAPEALEWYQHRLNAMVPNAGFRSIDSAVQLSEGARLPGSPQQSLWSALPSLRRPPVSGPSQAQAAPQKLCTDNPIWVDRLGDTCEAYKALRYLCEDKVYGAAAKENCKRSCGQCEVDMPESLLVLSPNGHQEKSGIYTLVKNRVVNGFPLWQREDGTKVFIFSGLNGNWLLGGEKEESQNFKTNAGWFYTYNRHGIMPHQLGGAWWRFDGGRWVHDASIEISPYQAAGAYSAKSMDTTTYGCVFVVSSATVVVLILLVGVYCNSGRVQRASDETEMQDLSMTGCFIGVFAFTAIGFGGLWYTGLIQPMWQTLIVIVYGFVAAGWFVGLLLIQVSRKFADKPDADAKIAKGINILDVSGELKLDPGAHDSWHGYYDVEGAAPRKKVSVRMCQADG